MAQLRSEFNSMKNETTQELRVRDHAEKELKNRIINLEARLEESNREKERLKDELNHEVDRLTKTHQETVNLLRDDNRELEKRYFEELSEKRRDEEMTFDKEREYINEINSLKREIAHIMDENSRMKLNKMSASGKKDSKLKKSARKSSRIFNSDTEEDSSVFAASRGADQLRLYEIDIQGKNLKIMELKGNIYFFL